MLKMTFLYFFSVPYYFMYITIYQSNQLHKHVLKALNINIVSVCVAIFLAYKLINLTVYTNLIIAKGQISI